MTFAEDYFGMQGVIVAAPVFAATGSRWKAMATALASVSIHRLTPLQPALLDACTEELPLCL